MAVRHVGILAPGPGIKPAPPALEGEVLTTGPPGKSWELVFNRYRVCGDEKVLEMDGGDGYTTM